MEAGTALQSETLGDAICWMEGLNESVAAWSHRLMGQEGGEVVGDGRQAGGACWSWRRCTALFVVPISGPRLWSQRLPGDRCAAIVLRAAVWFVI